MHPICLSSAASPSTPTACCWRRRTCWRCSSRSAARGGSASTATACSTSGIYIIIAALVGAKLMLLIVDFDYFSQHPARVAVARARPAASSTAACSPRSPSALWYMAEVPAARCGRRRTSFAPGIALGHVVGRLGCLLAGCCYGRPTTMPWAITFTDPFAATNVGTPLGMSAAPDAALRGGAELLILVLAARHRARGPPFAGRTFWVYIAALRRLALRHRVLPRRPARLHDGLLDVAVHLAGPGAARDRHARSLLWRQARRPRPKPCRRRGPRPAETQERDTSGLTRTVLVVPAGTTGLTGPTRDGPVRAAGDRRRRRPAPRPFPRRAGPGFSRSQIQRLIRDGVVTRRRTRREGQLARPRGRSWSRATCRRQAPAQPLPENLPLDVLYEDADLVVVNKPAGMVVHPAPGHAGGTLVNALLHHVDDLSGIGGELRPGIVHRLDRGTSGVMVVGQERRGAPGAVAAVPRPRGREGIRGARLGPRAAGPPHRRGDRARPARPDEDVARAPGSRDPRRRA